MSSWVDVMAWSWWYRCIATCFQTKGVTGSTDWHTTANYVGRNTSLPCRVPILAFTDCSEFLQTCLCKGDTLRLR
eukprot:scaffold6342_cov206-Alexandrium_tamarense.AAC.3